MSSLQEMFALQPYVEALPTLSLAFKSLRVGNSGNKGLTTVYNRRTMWHVQAHAWVARCGEKTGHALPSWKSIKS